MPSDIVRVCSVPHASANPYITAINRALARLGVVFTEAAHNPKEIRALLRPGLILHFHWPSILYSGKTEADFARKTGKLIDLLDRAKAAGCHIVWTAHNIFPHENPFPELDLAARRQFVRRCDHILVHCEAGRRQLEQAFPHLPPTTIAPHPDYRGEYPVALERAAARAALQLPRDEIVFLMFGMLRPYKNFAFAISAFRALRRPKARLLIAGGTLPGDDAAWLKQLARGDDRIELRVARVPDAQVSVLFGAADVALFSYERILASGGVALAQGLGRAVIAPRIGCLPDMVPENTGLLYEPGSEESLSAAMDRIAGLDADEMGRQGRMHIARQTPDVFAATLFGVYRGLARR